jgi:hypothetical protein
MTGPPKPPLRLSEHSALAPNQASARVFGGMNSPNPTECIAPMRLVPGTRRGTEPHELRHRTCLPRICAVGKDLAQPTTPLAFTGVALAWPAPRARQVLAADLQTHEWTLSNRRTGPLSAISGSPFATIGEH